MHGKYIPGQYPPGWKYLKGQCQHSCTDQAARHPDNIRTHMHTHTTCHRYGLVKGTLPPVMHLPLYHGNTILKLARVTNGHDHRRRTLQWKDHVDCMRRLQMYLCASICLLSCESNNLPCSRPRSRYLAPRFRASTFACLKLNWVQGTSGPCEAELGYVKGACIHVRYRVDTCI